MTSLTIHLPDELVQRIEKTGILKSPEIIELLEQMTLKAEQQQSEVNHQRKLGTARHVFKSMADDFDAPM